MYWLETFSWCFFSNGFGVLKLFKISEDLILWHSGVTVSVYHFTSRGNCRIILKFFGCKRRSSLLACWEKLPAPTVMTTKASQENGWMSLYYTHTLLREQDVNVHLYNRKLWNEAVAVINVFITSLGLHDQLSDTSPFLSMVLLVSLDHKRILYSW